MQKRVLLAVAVVALAAVVLMRGSVPKPGASAQAPRPERAVAVPRADSEPPPPPTPSEQMPVPPGPAISADHIPRWTPDEGAVLAPEPALESVRLVVRNYAARFKGNPVGNNAEITATLRGDNPAGAQFLDATVHRVNERGEWVDGWGQPYFFHQESAQEMEIRSAGPDRVMWTSDDVVHR